MVESTLDHAIDYKPTIHDRLDQIKLDQINVRFAIKQTSIVEVQNTLSEEGGGAARMKSREPHIIPLKKELFSNHSEDYTLYTIANY